MPRAAVAASVSQHIAVIGTEGTIGGGAYQTAIRRLNPAAHVTSLRLFPVRGHGGGGLDRRAHRGVGRAALPGSDFHAAPMPRTPWCWDARIFLLLCAALRAVLPRHVAIVDSAATTAAAVREELGGAAGPQSAGPQSEGGGAGVGGAVTWLATDGAARFARVGSAFLGESLDAEAIEIIDL